MQVQNGSSLIPNHWTVGIGVLAVSTVAAGLVFDQFRQQSSELANAKKTLSERDQTIQTLTSQQAQKATPASRRTLAQTPEDKKRSAQTSQGARTPTSTVKSRDDKQPTPDTQQAKQIQRIQAALHKLIQTHDQFRNEATDHSKELSARIKRLQEAMERIEREQQPLGQMERTRLVRKQQETLEELQSRVDSLEKQRDALRDTLDTCSQLPKSVRTSSTQSTRPSQVRHGERSSTNRSPALANQKNPLSGIPINTSQHSRTKPNSATGHRPTLRATTVL
jgi:DNA repair exonuclease SbcCD ATPase subunit